MIKSSSFSLNGSLSLKKDELFSNIKLEVQLHQWTVIIGQSGTGKSTLLKIIANLNIPIAFNNTISKNIDEDLSFSWMAQNDLLLPWLNVLENITLGQKLRREKISK